MVQAFFARNGTKDLEEEIEVHADIRLTRKTQRNIIDITNNSDAEDSTSYIDLNENGTDKSDTKDTKKPFFVKNSF